MMIFEAQGTAGAKSLLLFGAAVGCSTLLAYIVYQRLLSPLAKYPGPFWASLTDFWLARQAMRPDCHRRYIRLHEKYGPVVRVKPNKLSIASPDAFRIMYGAGTNFNKGESYIPFRGMRTFDLFTERDERVHGQQRRLVASAYTMNAIKSLEPYVNHTTAVLLAKLGELSAKGQAVNIAYLLQLFAFDVIGEVSFARRFGCTDALNDHDVFRTTAAGTASVSKSPVSTSQAAVKEKQN